MVGSDSAEGGNPGTLEFCGTWNCSPFRTAERYRADGIPRNAARRWFRRQRLSFPALLAVASQLRPSNTIRTTMESELMKLKMPRKRVTIVVATAMAVALGGGVAYAYFTAPGTGTGQAVVGTSGTWAVTAATAGGTAIVPGLGASTILFTITNTNPGSASQSYNDITATVAADVNGDITEGATDIEPGTPVTGCSATWFSPAVGTPSPVAGSPIAVNASGTVTVTVTMPTNATTNQDACKGTSPDITLTVDPGAAE